MSDCGLLMRIRSNESSSREITDGLNVSWGNKMQIQVLYHHLICNRYTSNIWHTPPVEIWLLGFSQTTSSLLKPPLLDVNWLLASTQPIDWLLIGVKFIHMADNPVARDFHSLQISRVITLHRLMQQWEIQSSTPTMTLCTSSATVFLSLIQDTPNPSQNLNDSHLALQFSLPNPL